MKDAVVTPASRDAESPAAFDALNAAAYSNAAALKSYANRTGLWDFESRLIGTYFRPDRPVLDLGCGCGRTTGALVQLGYAVTGVDLSEQFIETARQTVPGATFVHADVRELPLAGASFDQVVFSFNGLDCVYPLVEYERALIEIRRVLRPGGIFIYSGHNILGYFGRNLRSLREFAEGVRGHPGYLWMQRHGARHRDWYWRYDHSYGEIVLFSAPPWVHRRLQREHGFETLEVSGPDKPRSETWLTWFEAHMQYVVRKL